MHIIRLIYVYFTSCVYGVHPSQVIFKNLHIVYRQAFSRPTIHNFYAKSLKKKYRFQKPWFVHFLIWNGLQKLQPRTVGTNWRRYDNLFLFCNLNLFTSYTLSSCMVWGCPTLNCIRDFVNVLQISYTVQNINWRYHTTLKGTLMQIWKSPYMFMFT